MWKMIPFCLFHLPPMKSWSHALWWRLNFAPTLLCLKTCTIPRVSLNPHRIPPHPCLMLVNQDISSQIQLQHCVCLPAVMFPHEMVTALNPLEQWAPNYFINCLSYCVLAQQQKSNWNRIWYQAVTYCCDRFDHADF